MEDLVSGVAGGGSSGSGGSTSVFDVVRDNKLLFRYVPSTVLQYLSHVRRDCFEVLRSVMPGQPWIWDDLGLLCGSSHQYHTLRDACIVIADISGFTKLNEKFSSQANGAEKVR